MKFVIPDVMPKDPEERQRFLDEAAWYFFAKVSAFVERRLKQEGLSPEDAKILMDMLAQASAMASEANARMLEAATV